MTTKEQRDAAWAAYEAIREQTYKTEVKRIKKEWATVVAVAWMIAVTFIILVVVN